MSKKFFIFGFISLAAISGFFYFRHQVYFSRGEAAEEKVFEIAKGEGSGIIAAKLEKEGLIAGKVYFYYYLKAHNLQNKILPGRYSLSGKMTIPEIAVTITNEKNILPGYVKITFPEGWDSKKMAERLAANGLAGEGFLKIAKEPGEILNEYAFLRESGVKNLEGYLFPDTYFFGKNSDAAGIVRKMLDNFSEKVPAEAWEEAKKQNKNMGEVLTMASIIEKEVAGADDRKMVSGIFWNRIKAGQALQSCATLAYILGVNKKQYSYADTRVASPYNTYLHKGLPPGPIGNPGLAAIEAALSPQDSAYNYFLSDPETGQTVFSKTLDEHSANKVKYGL